jgi:epidermal growth factor receptor substrate 15
MRSILTLTMLFLSFCAVYAQNAVIDGRMGDQDTKKRLGGVTITVTKDGKQITQSTSASNGSYSVSFPVPGTYRIEYAKTGYTSKFMIVNTSGLSEEDMPIGGKVFPPIDIDLFSEKPNADLSFMKSEPVVDWKWDARRLVMDWNKDQANAMKKRIEDAIEKADKDGKENEAKYAQLIKDADALFVAQKHEEALAKYTEAIKIPGKAAEAHPNNRIVQIDEVLKKKAKEDMLAKQADEGYNNLIAEADKLKKDKRYDQAAAKYTEASKMKPAEAYPKEMLKEIEAIKKAELNKAEYESFIQQADKFMKQNSLQAARDKYNKASQLDPSQQYPKDQIKLIDGKLKEQEEQLANKKKYDDAVAAADQLFDQKKYQEAKAKYQEALTYESAASYPAERIKMADEKIKELEAEAEKEKKFQEFVKKGNEALNASKFDDAIKSFESALALKKDANAEKQLQAAKDGKAKLDDAAAKQNKIKDLLAKTDSQIASEKWDEALGTVNEVLTLEANNTQALEKKKQIEAGKKAQQDAANTQKQFDQLKSEANDLFNQQKYAEAKAKYEAANKLIAGQADVAKRIEECQKKIDESNATAKLNEQINKLIEAGDKADAKNEFDAAIKSYEEALALDKSRSDIKDKIAATKKKKADADTALAQKAKFEELKAKADKSFAAKSWEAAKAEYNEAKKFGSDPKIEANLAVIEQELAKLASNAQKEAKYKEIMSKADAKLASDDLKAAKDLYNEALAYKDKDLVALGKIKDIDEELKKRDAAAQEEQQFKKLKEEGENLFAQKKWNESKQKFLEAKKIKDDAQVESKLKEIEKELAKLSSEKEREEQYKSLMASADKQEKADKLKEAIGFYEQALAVKEGDAAATNKINELRNELKRREKDAALGDSFNKAIQDGKTAMNVQDYARAIELFDDALEVKPMDPEAMKLKTEAKKKLDDLSKNEAAYQKLLADGLRERNNGNLLAAKDLYKQAQQIRQSDPLPQKAIVEIDELLRKKQEEEEANKSVAERNKQYNDKMQLANLAASNFKYEDAIKHLKDAANIKPEESEPRKKIAEYQGLLDQINAASTTEKNYQDALRKADLAFDNKEYQKSIELYEAALKIKSDPYPVAQIEKAKRGIEDVAKGDVNRKYQDVILKANGFFANEKYQEALAEYNKALEIIPGDKFASDRRDETQQILNNLSATQAKKKADKEKIDALIKQADVLFNSKNYLDAKRKYEEALAIDNSNVYAIKQVDECVRLAKKAVTEDDDVAYRKIVDKADEYFNDENYDRARNLYERALKLRSYDKYPKDQIAEIERRLRAPEKKTYELENLGEEVNISIIDGEALFAKAEKVREQEQKAGILRRIFANERNFEEKILNDDQERLAYQNEIVAIKDRRNQLVVDELAALRELAINLDDEQYSIAQQRIQELSMEYAAQLRQNEQITYIMQDFDNLHNENSDKHLVNAEKLDELVQIKEVQQRAKDAIERESVLKMDEELISISDNIREDYQRSEDMRKVNEDAVRGLEAKYQGQYAYDLSDNYNKIQDLKRQATLAEIAKYESSQEKAAIQLMLEEDIALLVGVQSEKTRAEYDKVRAGQLEVDQLLVRASEQYKETYADSDNARKETVESIKTIRAGQDAMMDEANRDKYNKIQNNTSEVESIKIMTEEKFRLMDEDLLAISEELVKTQDVITRANRIKADEEIANRQTNVDKIEQTKADIRAVEAEKVATPKDNKEAINVIESTINMGQTSRDEEFKDRKLNTNKLLEDMASSKIQMTEAIANQLGEDFPEGVTQNVFMVKDSKGHPQKITTRRIVVVSGRGDVFYRVQTRNGVTYSKNGEPISEAAWIKGTEDNKLTRHF